MKTNKLFKLFSIITMAAAGAFALVNVSNKSSKKVESVEAADTYTYYLTGSFNSWTTNKANCIAMSDYQTNEVKILGHTFTGNNTFKALRFKNGNFDAWMGDITGTGSGSNQISSASGINVYAYSNNAGIHYNNDNNSRQFNIIYNYFTNHFYIDYAYKLTVGSSSFWMEPNPSNSAEMRGSGSGSSGDSLSVTYFMDSKPGTFSLGANDKPSNNLTSAFKLKVSGSFDFYMLRSNWSNAWATGYAPSNQSNLESFCNNLLNLDCNSTDLSGCGWSSLSASEKNAFNGATVTFGSGVSYDTYGSVVNEAATRYALLISKGATALSGVTLSVRTMPMFIKNESTNTIAIIIVISLVSVSAIGGYFFLRKRKENN